MGTEHFIAEIAALKAENAELRESLKHAIACCSAFQSGGQAELRALLADARDKLRHYRAAHGGEYVGGVEYSALMNRIQEALK